MSHNVVPTSAIPEVVAFDQAKQRLLQFKAANSAYYDALTQLVEDYNQKLEAADKVVRAQQVSCGDFDLYSKRPAVDGKALHDALGRPLYITVGGSVAFAVAYKVDAKKLQLAAAQGLVPQNIMDETVSETQMYHTPKSVGLP
jgi:hypothetical protein